MPINEYLQSNGQMCQTVVYKGKCNNN